MIFFSIGFGQPKDGCSFTATRAWQIGSVRIQWFNGQVKPPVPLCDCEEGPYAHQIRVIDTPNA